jgi:hypothetical protein
MLAREYLYREAANLLDAVKQFMSHFDQYLHIPVIGDIQRRVDTIKNYLTNHIRKTFRDLAKVNSYTHSVKRFLCSYLQ